jgi:hypothetical protein
LSSDSSEDRESEDENEKEKEEQESIVDKFDINNFIDSHMNVKLLEPPPDYKKVCPPTYEESSYYPTVEINILPEEEYDMIEFLMKEESKKAKTTTMSNLKKDEDEEDNDFVLKKNEIVEEEDPELVIEEADSFAHETLDFVDKFSKLNFILERAIADIDKIKKPLDDDNTEKKSKNFGKKNENTNTKSEKKSKNDIIEECDKVKYYIENVYFHNANDFNYENNYNVIEYQTLKNEIFVEIENFKEITTKYINLKKLFK